VCGLGVAQLADENDVRVLAEDAPERLTEAFRIEADLALVRSERAELTRQLPAPVLADYDKLLKARGGLALAQVMKPNLCGGCRMTVTPQRLQELRAQSALLPCESCGRYLYWLA